MDSGQIVSLVTDLVTQWGLKVLGAIAVLVIGRIVAGVIRRSVERAVARSKVDNILVPFLSGLVYYLVIAIVLIAVLRLFGLETTSLVAVVGAAGLAIGLAIQGTLSNFASGVMLMVFRPFKVGDVIEAGGSLGVAAELGIFSTTLTSPDNVKITVPNAQIYGQTIRNFNGYDTRRVDLVIGISYDDDIGRAIETIDAIVRRDERVLIEPAPKIAVAELADSSVNLVARPWCKGEDYWDLKFDLTRRFKEELEAAGCSLPYPQRDVHVHEKVAP